MLRGDFIDNLKENKSFLIGVLALQGAFHEHIEIINKLDGVKAIAVRNKEQLDSIDALILPGGESTAMSLIAERMGLLNDLREFVRVKPTWGTCAGLILLSNSANQIKKGGQELLGGLPITVNRNQFGSQVESFEANLTIECLSTLNEPNLPYKCLFIRAPVIIELDPSVEILSTINYHNTSSELSNQLNIKEFIVAVKKHHLLGTSFHPELTNDYRWHMFFINMVKQFYQTKVNNISKLANQLNQVSIV